MAADPTADHRSRTAADPVSPAGLAQALLASGQPERALVEADRVLRQDPGHAPAHMVRARALDRIGFFSAAVDAFDTAWRLDLGLVHAPSLALDAANHACAWSDRRERIAAVLAGARDGGRGIHPFSLLALTDDPALQRDVARARAARTVATPPWPAPSADSRRLRLGFVSAALRDHPLAWLLLDLLQRLDRDRFEVIAIATRARADAVTDRVAAAVDRMIDASGIDDDTLVTRIRAAELDIALDCDGFTDGGRHGAFRKRLAPVQVGFLGFPGTSGGVHDYFIADPVTVPRDLLPFFDEAVVRLPHTYACNSHATVPPAPVPGRAAHGLPGTGFVFCCFNTAWKLTPEVFAVWMRLLHRVAGSVLWLRSCPRDTVRNLVQAVADAGIEPHRLVFAPRLDTAAHLARLSLADLFLDTLPCNAHSTALDALWAGVPVLTCPGRAFAARVAASHLHAAGLPELVVDSLAAYEAAAVRLATRGDERAALRLRLAGTCRSGPLFDTAGYARHLSVALLAMHARSADGAPPAGFDVTDSGDVDWS